MEKRISLDKYKVKTCKVNKTEISLKHDREHLKCLDSLVDT